MDKTSTEMMDSQAPQNEDWSHFGELFAKISQDYPDLNVPTETELKKLDEAYIRSLEQRQTRTYITATTLAVLLGLSFPILLIWGYQAISSIQTSILPHLNHKSYIISHPPIVGLLSGISFMAITSAILLYKDYSNWPIFRSIPSFILSPFIIFSLKDALPHIKSDGWRFRLYQAIMIYIGIGMAIFLIYNLANPTIQPYAAFSVKIWLFFPVIPLSASPTFLLMVVIVIFSQESKSQEAIFVNILSNILSLLNVFKKTSQPSQISLQNRLKAIRKIEETAALFGRLYIEEHSSSKVKLWTQARMERVSDNFLALNAWIAFPKSDSVTSLKKRLVKYANVLSLGTLDDLPSQKIDESFPFIKGSKKRGYLRRLGSLVWLLILVTLPLVAYIGTAVSTNWTIPKPLQTPAAISYSAWVAACLLAHIEELAPEAKTTLIDVVKAILRR